MPVKALESAETCKAYIQAIEYYLPVAREENVAGDRLNGKLGITSRAIAAEGETAGDMAFAAAQRLLDQELVARSDIDFLLLCTQSADYVLPSTACVLQHRLGLAASCGALDVNQGCSGYVYCLSLAKGLIEAGMARHVLLLTGDTYSKYTHSLDRSVRLLFGDGASATLISAAATIHEPIGPFVFGTDGSGASQLIVPAGGARLPLTTCTDEELAEREDTYGNVRTAAHLYMDGPGIFSFTLNELPNAFHKLLDLTGRTRDDYDWFVFHQANRFMLEQLRRKLEIAEERLPVLMADYGNTVSSSIPIALRRMQEDGSLQDGQLLMLMGFGVGLSWAACNVQWRETKTEQLTLSMEVG